MINKLRKKFIIAALLSVFALLAVILLVINFVNFSIVSDQADDVLEQIIRQGGAFPEGFVPQEGMGDMGQGGGPRRQIGPNSPELRNTTRYFTVDYDKEGNAIRVDLHMNAANEAEAKAWADSLKKYHGGWTRTYYRYKVWTDEMGTHVTVIDQSRELSPSYRVLIASCVGIGVGMVVAFLALLGISKFVVEPIEQSDRRQKRFIRDAAFEIKNPITVIDTNRHILDLRVGESEETKAIDHEVKHLTKLVEGLDSLLLLEDGEANPTFKQFDLSSLVGEIGGSYLQPFATVGKHLTLDVESGVAYTGDPMQIGELINICMDNALAYSKSQATLTLKRMGERVALEFRNDADIAEEGALDSVFERFYRSEEVRESGIVGAGIQLSVARAIVTKHGGRIAAEGKDGYFIVKVEL